MYKKVDNGLGDVLGLPDPEVNEHLGLGPSVDGFHRPVVRGRPYPGHRPHDIYCRRLSLNALEEYTEP